MRAFSYAFCHHWRLDAPPERVFPALADAESWPRWWPQIRSGRMITEDRGVVEIRSVLPVTLRLVLSEPFRDEAAGVLRARIDGDLVGWVRWTLAADGRGGSVVTLDQQVEVRGRALRLLSLPCRPLLRLNHELMMRSGERGLRRWLFVPEQTDHAPHR